MDVDDVVVEVYERILAEPGGAPAIAPEQLDRAVDVLRGLRLVRPRGEGWEAVDPEVAQAELRRVADDRDRRLRPFEDAFHRTRSAAPDDLGSRLAEVAGSCATEIVVMHTCVAQETPRARFVRPLVVAAAKRGVPVRLLFPHTGRGDTVTRAYLRDVTDAGGEVRTSGEVPDRFVVFDRRIAFLLGEDGVDHAGAVVDQPVLARFLHRIHDHVWQSALRFSPGQTGYGSALGALKSSILRLLASGLTDDVIARRVGISERTLRRHIAAIMRDMSAESRFQAGFAAAEAGLLRSRTTHTQGDLQCQPTDR
ncbi:LuxR C-terminal-related transcriptional regulator [Actinosynnema sp. NPDC020468]|uniref:helix-turn-helix transcriptional regulator n=1 Tax=Actinosynnema sp. NPDC020468 TaxID=3154488 RepID=UPI0033EC9036